VSRHCGRRKVVNNSNGVDWPVERWEEINEAVVNEVGHVRIAQKIFPTMVFKNNPTVVLDDVINFGSSKRDGDRADDKGKTKLFSIDEGKTKPFVEIYQEFTLTTTQVAEDKEGESKICKTLARMGAKAAALREDAALFSGQKSSYPETVVVDRIESMKDGLLGEADPRDAKDDDANKVSKPIRVLPPEVRRKGILFGENVFSAVADGIAKLVSKAQAKPYALVLPERIYANTFAPPGDQSLVTVAEMIEPLVEGGFYGTATLPEDRGLLVALGGNPISLYVGHEAAAEFVQQEKQSVYFRVMERVQFVARDPRALVRLDFDFNELRRRDAEKKRTREQRAKKAGREITESPGLEGSTKPAGESDEKLPR
jgi:uncharacterized linocin/CFP29 family protein